MQPRFLHMAPLLILLCASTGALADEALDKTDETTLKEAGLRVDSAGLLQFFKDRTLSPADQIRLAKSVRQLGDARQSVRDKASRDLIDAAYALNEGGGGALRDGKPFINSIGAAEKVSANFTVSTANRGGHSSVPRDDNAIYEIAKAASTHVDNGKGTLVYKDNAHLRGPLGLTMLPNGNLITSNSDAINPSATQTSEYVEFTQGGQFVGQFSIDPNPGGAFGLASMGLGDDVLFAAVNDNQGTLTLWHFEG